MHVIYAQNPDDALAQGIVFLKDNGLKEESRNGTVLVAPGPVATVYADSTKRVSYSATRDANPFFHLMEAMWMLAGKNDVKTVARYAARMREFSDDGITLNGAYGYRWRESFDDQLTQIVTELKKNPDTRRLVLSMWDPERDPYSAASGGKDVPCNTHAYVWQRAGLLHLTVCCRSNDIVWGAYGANVVQFSFLQEYLACRVGLGLGTYTQISNNYHAYIDRPDVENLFYPRTDDSPQPFGEHRPLQADIPGFDDAVRTLMKEGAWSETDHPFLRQVVMPMLLAHANHKAGSTEAALKILEDSTIDWHIAGYSWLLRRLTKQRQTLEVR